MDLYCAYESCKKLGGINVANVLFVKANDRPADQSVSVKMYDTFLKKNYKESHSGDVMTEIDLFNENLPYYGNTAITGLFKKNSGAALTAEEEKITGIIDGYLNQFLQADKVVFAFPLWNFTVPAPLITYISYLAQVGKTFKYTAEGPVGLAGGKKVALLSARGGIYSNPDMQPLEMAVNYVKSITGFWGINNPEIVIIEGHNQFPDQAEKIVAEGLAKTAEVASRF
ncbi:FMN-dependent NADH-azoreductase [Terrilactibacillus sp. S3-3]|nr:FMN-dependent NADH-azoreductase [Terrilactibacillus sp. S3-3]